MSSPGHGSTLSITKVGGTTDNSDHLRRLADPPGRIPSVADQFADLLRELPPKTRRGMIVRLSTGFYEGWRPSRAEVADAVAVELGVLGVEESIARQRLRQQGLEPAEDVMSRVLSRRHDGRRLPR